MAEDFMDEDDEEVEEGDENVAPTEKSSVYGETEGTTVSEGDDAQQKKKKKVKMAKKRKKKRKQVKRRKVNHPVNQSRTRIMRRLTRKRN